MTRRLYRCFAILAIVSLGCASGFAQKPLHSAGDERDRLLDSGWQFRLIGTAPAGAAAAAQEWHAATVPGVVQTDLLANKLIPDPFYGENEKVLQWIGLADWEYRSTFTITTAELSRTHVELVFDGLDTLADVEVNGKLALSADNDFRQWTIDAKPLLHAGENELRIVFRSPITKMLPVVKAMPYHLPTVGQVQTQSEGGIAVDPYVRKAPYNFGWDWGPRYVTAGIWHHVHLRTWDALRMSDVGLLQTKVSAANANIDAQLHIDASAGGNVLVNVSYAQLDLYLHAEHGAFLSADHRTVHVDAGANDVSLPFSIAKPKLWWPNGYGEQYRYLFRVTVSRNGRVLATQDISTGLRSAELRRKPDQWGKSFEFVINGVPIFAKGADVIPFDSFAPRVTPEQHRDILSSARRANMNMVRDWGGGYYESDDYYDLADELGIMVWQEFMFGGAMVPGGEDFRANVAEEAKQQVIRLRNHPSVITWCGNNEVETGSAHWGDYTSFKHSLKPDQQQEVWQNYVLVMNDVLKSAVARYDPGAGYMPSSPSNNYDSAPDSDTDGDKHYWQVWGGNAPIADYTKQNARFMSEYGFQSFPEMRTIREFAPEDQLALDSPVMHAHQKAGGGNERIRNYMKAEYPDPKDFASFVYLSQVQQAEAIRIGAETLRRDRPRTMGSLFWQLNDCWPVASWASIDWYGRWKALQWYAVRFYAPVLVSPSLHDGQVDAYVVSDLQAARSVSLRVTVETFDGHIVSTQETPFAMPPLSSTQVRSDSVQTLLQGHDPATVFAVYELVENGKIVPTSGSVPGTIDGANYVYFAPVKELKLQTAKIEVSYGPEEDDGTEITLISDVLARDVYVDYGERHLLPADNFFTLRPGVPLELKFGGIGSAGLKTDLKVMSLMDAFSGSEE